MFDPHLAEAFATQNALTVASDQPLRLESLLYNLVIGVALAFALRWHFVRFGTALGNRREFSGVFPLVMLATILVITIVKHSLALSLGLVGALSIVRFRTPIKEPEELGYLFLAIAAGLGLGADQTLITSVAMVAILTALALLRGLRGESGNKNLYLTVAWPTESPTALQTLQTIVGRHVVENDLRRLDAGQGRVDATFHVDIASPGRLSQLLEELRQHCPGVSVTFLDQSRMPSV